MSKNWESRADEWRTERPLPKEISGWAIEGINKNMDLIESIERKKNIKDQNELNDRFKSLRQSIKTELVTREKEIDGLTLNTPNSYKLQVSIPTNLKINPRIIKKIVPPTDQIKAPVIKP